MDKKIISFDLGTGGNKASLYDVQGNCLASAFVPYATQYPQVGWHEQRPADWWQAVVESTRQLLQSSQVEREAIVALAISGHSLGAVPVDRAGKLLREATPIWSDIRAQQEVEAFFKQVDPDEWYLTTGNGFPAACYTIFKVMWYQRHEPEMWQQVDTILGTKDYINYLLTGQLQDGLFLRLGHGHLQPQGVGLRAGSSSPPAASRPRSGRRSCPPPSCSARSCRRLPGRSAWSQGVQVACGGVDNSCMALGAKNNRAGRVYTSLGSSAWIAVSSEQPVLDKKFKPYVFAHVIPHMFTSAVSIFAAGSSFAWVKDNLCGDLVEEARQTGAGRLRADEPGSRQSAGWLEQTALQPQPGGRHLAG